MLSWHFVSNDKFPVVPFCYHGNGNITVGKYQLSKCWLGYRVGCLRNITFECWCLCHIVWNQDRLYTAFLLPVSMQTYTCSTDKHLKRRFSHSQKRQTSTSIFKSAAFMMAGLVILVISLDIWVQEKHSMKFSWCEWWPFGNNFKQYWSRLSCNVVALALMASKQIKI